MNLHRPFKMDSSSYLPTPLASPALMVLASTAEAGRDASVPCQTPRSFGVPVSIDKDLHLSFPSASYTFTSMYHRQGPISGAFSSRDFPASLLHLHPQFASPNLDCSSLGMLNHSGVGAFRPFSSPPEEREVGRYNSAFTPAKRPKGCYADSEGKGYEFGTPGGSLQAVADDTARKPFAVSGLLSDGEGSSSPEEYKDGCLKGLFDSQSPMCPVCQAILRPGEMQEHMEEEMAQLKQLHISAHSAHGDHLLGTSKSLSLSLQIKYEGGSSNPRSPEDLHSDRYQTFLRVRANRHTRLNVDDLYWCRCYTKPAPLRPHNGAHLAPDYTQAVRIGKLKRRKPEEGHHDGPTDLGGDEDEWSEKRRMTSILGGFKGAVMLSSRKVRDGRDSDVDLDVDGDDTMEYGRPQYTETDVIPCAAEEHGDVEGREVGITSVGLESDQLTLDCSKWKNEGSPSTSNGESNKLDNSMSILNTTCKNSNIEMVSEDCALTTLDALKARIRDLEKQLSKGDRYKCLICMDTYTTPLTSIQCWHVHCEECWLRTLGAKKLCPQCNTITSPGDLRRVYL